MNSPSKDATRYPSIEPISNIPARHVSFTPVAIRHSPLSKQRAATFHQAGPSRPTSGPLVVESILEEEALARNSEPASIHLY